jgi:hypothetical protein
VKLFAKSADWYGKPALCTKFLKEIVVLTRRSHVNILNVQTGLDEIDTVYNVLELAREGDLLQSDRE